MKEPKECESCDKAAGFIEKGSYFICKACSWEISKADLLRYRSKKSVDSLIKNVDTMRKTYCVICGEPFYQEESSMTELGCGECGEINPLNFPEKPNIDWVKVVCSNCGEVDNVSAVRSFSKSKENDISQA